MVDCATNWSIFYKMTWSQPSTNWYWPTFYIVQDKKPSTVNIPIKTCPQSWIIDQRTGFTWFSYVLYVACRLSSSAFWLLSLNQASTAVQYKKTNNIRKQRYYVYNTEVKWKFPGSDLVPDFWGDILIVKLYWNYNLATRQVCCSPHVDLKNTPYEYMYCIWRKPWSQMELGFRSSVLLVYVQYRSCTCSAHSNLGTCCLPYIVVLADFKAPALSGIGHCRFLVTLWNHGRYLPYQRAYG